MNYTYAAEFILPPEGLPGYVEIEVMKDYSCTAKYKFDENRSF